MNAQQAREAIQFLEQEQTHNNNDNDEGSSPDHSLSLVSREEDHSDEEELNNIASPDDRFSEASFPYDRSTRESSPIRTAFAHLLEMSLESKLSPDDADNDAKVNNVPKTMPLTTEKELSLRDTPPPPPSPISTESVNVDSKPAESDDKVFVKPHSPPLQPVSHPTTSIASVNTSTEYDNESDNGLDDDEDDEIFLQSFESSILDSPPSKLKTYGVNGKILDDSLDISDSSHRNFNINVHSNSILENDSSNLPKSIVHSSVSTEPKTTSSTSSKEKITLPIDEDLFHMDRITAADRLDEKLDGLLSSTPKEEVANRREGGEVGGVASRVNQTFHKIKEMATPYLPTRLPTTSVCHTVKKEDADKPVSTTKPFENKKTSRSNDIIAVTVIDTSHTSAISSGIPSKKVSSTTEQHQRVPMMRMRNPAEQDFLVEHESLDDDSPLHEKNEEEFMQRKSQQWKAKKKQADKQQDAERRRLESIRHAKEMLNGPDDIIACNNGLWKEFENFVVTRCGDVSDVLIDKKEGNNDGGSQYSPEGSAVSDDEKSEDSESMMRRLSERYLRKDANTVTSSLDGSASNHSTTESIRAQDVVPITTLNTVYRPSDNDMPPAPPSSSPPAREASLPIDQYFTEQFIQKTQSEGLDILIHRKVQSEALAGPLRAHAYLRDGKRGNGGEFCGPWLVWFSSGETKVRKGIDLFDIRSLDKASALQLEQYPLAIPGRSLFLRMNEGLDHVFEMQDEKAAVQFVQGMRWLIARLAYNLIAGNIHVSCEMLELDEKQRQSRLVESHRSSAMNELTNHLVEKSAAAM